jgi:hypothetical protein
VVVVLVPTLVVLELLVPMVVLVELELGTTATVVIVPKVCRCVVSCKAVVPLELTIVSLSSLVVSGIVVSVLRSSIVVDEAPSGLVSEMVKRRQLSSRAFGVWIESTNLLDQF